MSSSLTSTTSGSGASTTDPPLAFWSLADSLISSYYPSTTITNINELTFPPTVVIDGSTMVASSTVSHQTPTSTSSLVPTSSFNSNQAQQSSEAASTTSTASPSDGHNDDGDRRLGIILGVVLGFISLAMLFTLIWCLRRRRKQRGLKERRQPSPSQTEIARDWQQETTEDLSYQGPPQMWLNMYNRPAGQTTPSVSKHPAFLYSQTQAGSPAERRDPFLSLQEQSNAPPTSHTHNSSTGPTALPTELDATATATSSAPMLQPPRNPYARYPTDSSSSSSMPFYTPNEDLEPQHSVAPLDFLPQGESEQQSAPFLQHHEPTRPVAPAFPMPYTRSRQLANPDDGFEPLSYDRYDADRESNPFMSQEENDASADAISPILPVRNPRRRSAPKIHYPSWKEVSGFNFVSDGDTTAFNDERERRG